MGIGLEIYFGNQAFTPLETIGGFLFYKDPATDGIRNRNGDFFTGENRIEGLLEIMLGGSRPAFAEGGVGVIDAPSVSRFPVGG